MSEDGVTFKIQSLFYQGAYGSAIALASSNTSGSPSSEPTLTRLLYAARSHIASNNPRGALSLLPADVASSSAAARSVRALAAFVEARSQGDVSGADENLAELRETLDDAVVGDPSGQTIRVCAATAMALDDDPIGALETLGIGTASSREIECIALGVHILLSQHRADLAEKEYQAARTWADDSLLIQLIEAYIGLHTGGRSAQQAYYVYDELAQNPEHAGKDASVNPLVGKGVAQLVLGQRNEATQVLADAEKLDPNNVDMLANSAVLASYSASPAGYFGRLEQLRRVAPSHALVTSADEAAQAFDSAFVKHQEAQAAL
ncbi:hypothetical protein IE81DRAFT_346933 [Ceraceosorus guamensis]|uniref:Coatomer subunit epsilon n=1 Tax=Ceraceosorus guamensis TaxID=1522189 RepID=A0A316VZD1_9BASI|nr:hypothetical protein IE81DRAFT_346933 [Ceraceosorus guamensis]PWN42946.1 hypothetical protein IE81DRAFT_346933 [Ceraceosorus guamensis]